MDYDYDLEAADIKRKQAILDAMQAGALAPMQFAPPNQGGVASKTHWTNGLGKVLQAYSAHKGQEDLKERQQALSQRFSSDLRSGMENYERTSRGYTTPGDTPLPADVAGPVRAPEQVAGDPRKAVFDALGSNHPVLRDFAMKQLAEQGKGQLTPKDLSALANPADVLRNPQDARGWSAKPNVNPVAPGSVLYDANQNTFVNPAIPQGAGPTTETHNGDLYQRSPTGLKKLDNAPKVNVNTGDVAGTKFSSELAKNRAETITKSYEATKGIPASMGVLDEASANLSQGIKSGQLAEVGLALAKTAKAFGLGDVNPEIANTEAFRANMAGSVLEVLKTLRPASDKDVQYAEKAAGGTITLDDKTMLRLIDSARAAGLNKLSEHDALLSKNREASGVLPADLATFEIPFSVSDTHGGLEFKGGRFVPKVVGNAPKAKVIKWGDLP